MKKDDLKSFPGSSSASIRLHSAVKKFFAVILILSVYIAFLPYAAKARTYPYWDTSGPGTGDSTGHAILPPFAASPQAFYAIDSYYGIVVRWTECDGWDNSDIGYNLTGAVGGM